MTSGGSCATQILVTVMVCFSLAWVVYLLRIYTRVWIVRDHFAEDYLITFGMAALTAFTATVPIQIMHGGGKHVVDIANPDSNVPQWGRAFFIAELMYLLTLWSVKISVTSLLLRFSMTKTLDWILRATAAVTTALTIVFVMWLTFQCQPVQAQWDSRVDGVCASRKAFSHSVYGLSSVSAATDFVTAITPLFILRGLTIDTRSKWGAGATLGVGSLACVATLVRFKFIHEFAISEDVTYATVPLSICSFIEVSLGCICASLATLRPLLQKLWPDRRTFRAGSGESGTILNMTFSRESRQLDKVWTLAHGRDMQRDGRS